MDRLAFCFGVHNHQPIGNFDHVLVEATERAYRPFLERLDARPEVRLSMHWTGGLLEWLRDSEPHLPRVLREAGVEYVLLDDHHFALAGLDADALGGYYLTDEQGASLRVFPISQPLRYLIPFADVDKTLDYLDRRRATVSALTMVDDGEKLV